MANEKESYKDNEFYKEVKETEREVAKNPPQEEKIILKGDDAEDVRETEREVGKTSYEQNPDNVNTDQHRDAAGTVIDNTTSSATDNSAADVVDTNKSVVDANLGKRSENLSTGATHNDTGIFPQPE